MNKPESEERSLGLLPVRGTTATSISRDRITLIALALTVVSFSTVASAQETSNDKPEQPATSAVPPKVINIWPGVAPGSEQWKQKETTLASGDRQRVVNVTTPTLTVYLPERAAATGTAVIIAPGGGFIFLGTDTHEVAEWLAARGLAHSS